MQKTIKSNMATSTERIYGEKIFFNFMEVPYSDIEKSGDLVSKIKSNEIAGFVMKDVFSEEEINKVKQLLLNLDESYFMPTPTGKMLPAPFAIITDANERLDFYYEKLRLFDEAKGMLPELKLLIDRLDHFFKKVAKNYKVSVPSNKIKKLPVAPGTFRVFFPNMGGLHVHCGNLFQAQSMFYYSLLENDIDMNDQLSYFIVLQQSEAGGELTIYDMLWNDVKQKESPENNEFVIADDGTRIYVDKLNSFSVKPKPGDILVFSGGPIWHRVEDIKGVSPRITFGGFLNFSNKNDELFYWS